MPEPIDVFADAFRLFVGPFGGAIHFALSSPESQLTAAPGAAFTTDRVATIRLTPDLMKGLAFLLRNQVLAYERESGFKIELPPNVMAAALTATDRESWDRFWGYTS